MLNTVKRPVSIFPMEAVDAVEPAIAWAKRSDCDRFGIAPDTAGWTREWIRRHLERMDLASSVLLDLGSGGHSPLTCWYCGRVRHAFLIDLHDPPARFPRATSLMHDLEWPLPIPGESVDIVVSAGAFQFLTPAGRRLQMSEIQRVLRPDGIAILSMAWLFPLTPPALLTLAREPFMEQRKIRLFAASDVSDMLTHGKSLRVDGDFEKSRFPGFEGFSLDEALRDPDLLVTGLTDFDPSAFAPETVALGIRRFGLGMRLKKEPAKITNTQLDFEFQFSSETRGNPEELANVIGAKMSLAGRRVLVVECDEQDELISHLMSKGAIAERLMLSDHIDSLPADFDCVIARNCFHRMRDPAKILRMLAPSRAEIWIDDMFVDSGKYECTYIPPGDVVEHPRLGGRMRISLSWLFRELMRLDFDPELIAPAELPERNVRIPQSPSRMAISIARPRAANENPPLLVHVHVPKNAGSSFNDLLLATFGAQFVPMYLKDPGQRFDEFAFSTALRIKPQAQAVASHSFGVFPTRVAGYRPLYVAFLREPLARQYSYYRFGRKHFEELSREHLSFVPPAFQLMSVRDFLRFEISLAEDRVLNSSQVFLLTGGDDSRAAINNLSQFFFVGIVEQMELSMKLLRAKLERIGLPLNPCPLKRVNSTGENRNSDSADDLPEARELLKHLQPDVELYEWAQHRLSAEAKSLRVSAHLAGKQ